MLDLLRALVAPSKPKSIFRQDAAGRSNVGRVLAGAIVCLVVTALLSSDRLVAMAERMEFGPERDRWLAAAEAVDAVSDTLRLDRPAEAIEAALGRTSSESTVVVGELAATATVVEPAPTTTVVAAPEPTQVGRTSVTRPSTPSTTAAPTTTVAPTTTTVPVYGAYDVNRPLRIWAGGDSLGEYVGSRLQYKIADDATTEVELDYRISTGLTRPDYFDWPARMSELMLADETERPQVVLFMVGGNDDQDMQTADGRVSFFTDEWLAEYRQRVALMMDTTAYPGTQMVWVNLPPMRDERRHEMVEPVNRVLAEEASRRPWVTIADITALLADGSGGYQQFLTEPSGDKTVQARANDGVHITSAASEWIARRVWDRVNESWILDDTVAATTTTATASTTTAPPSTAPTADSPTTAAPTTTVPPGNENAGG